jgi:hypothetical protein
MANDELEPTASPSSAAVRFIRRAQESGQSITLTINGGLELSVRDSTSIDLLLDLVERIDLLDSIRQGMKELDEGKGLSLEQVTESIGRKQEVST